MSNNLIGSNNNLQYNKGGRVKLYNGGIPGFTEAEIAQRRNQQLRDAQERNRTSSKPITQMPMIPPGGAPKQPANLSPITNSPPAMSEQGALPGFGTNNPGGEEFIAVSPGGGGASGIGNITYDLGGQKVEDTIDLDKIMNMDTFQYDKFMSGLSPEKKKRSRKPTK